MGDTPAPPAKADDPSASNDDDDGAVPPVLYAGWFYKKMHGPNEIPVIGWLLEMLPGAGWSRRYVRLFPGKLEWYKDDTAASLRTPLGYGPLGVLDLERRGFRRIITTAQQRDDSAPTSHKRSLRLTFSEASELLHRVGMAAHHAEYLFSPDDEAQVHKFEVACDEAAGCVARWDSAVIEAATAAAKEKRNPLNAALAVVASEYSRFAATSQRE